MTQREMTGSVLRDAGVRPAHEIAGVTATSWRRQPNVVLAVVVLLVAVFAMYWRTTLSMVAIWERSETFAHGFVVIPIFFYLLWGRRDALENLEAKPCWPAMLGLVLAGVTWVLGEIVSAASVSQFAMVAMVPLAVWLVLGTRIAMALGIPLAFLFFAVPFGEFLVPTLMDRTADFTVAALRASGVPVYREGNYFNIPSGSWSVVEACSGLRYLIASLMVGCLYAYLTYRSFVRRALFIAASLVVPIIANWLRAYGIVMIGHLSSNRLAVGVDHLIYGWIFFGVVIALLLWIGARWREDDPLLSAGAPRQLATATDGKERGSRPVWAAALTAMGLMLIWQPLRAHFEVPESSAPVHLASVTGRDGWIATPDAMTTWRPDLSGSRDELVQTFIKGGQRVGLDIAFFRTQTSDTKAITSTNQLVRTTNLIWRRVDAGTAAVVARGSSSRVNTATIQKSDERLAVWQWYWVDGRATASEYEAKLLQVISILRGHGDSVGWVVIYVRDDDLSRSRATLEQFLTVMRGPLDDVLRQAASM